MADKSVLTVTFSGDKIVVAKEFRDIVEYLGVSMNKCLIKLVTDFVEDNRDVKNISK